MKTLFGWKGLTIAVVLLLVLVGIFINLRVNYRNYYDPFLEFEFELSFGAYGGNEIDTFRNTITKDLVLLGSATIDFVLSDSDRRDIFNMMYKMDIMNYPITLNYGFYDFEHPENFMLKVQIENEVKTIYWSVPWTIEEEDHAKMSDEQKAFLELAEYIKAIVNNSVEFKSLPAHQGGYM